MTGMDDSIGYDIKRLHLLTRQMLDRILVPYDLTQAQGEIIYNLLQQDGQTQALLGKTLKVTAPTINRMIDVLVEKGFVLRKEGKSNTRRKQIYLTPKGRKFKDELTAAQQQAEETLRRGFTKIELTQLKDYIDRMYRNVSKVMRE
jgi:MarR family transcriptional regulator, transcriptional regulator for hemolysin